MALRHAPDAARRRRGRGRGRARLGGLPTSRCAASCATRSTTLLGRQARSRRAGARRGDRLGRARPTASACSSRRRRRAPAARRLRPVPRRRRATSRAARRRAPALPGRPRATARVAAGSGGAASSPTASSTATTCACSRCRRPAAAPCSSRRSLEAVDATLVAAAPACSRAAAWSGPRSRRRSGALFTRAGDRSRSPTSPRPPSTSPRPATSAAASTRAGDDEVGRLRARFNTMLDTLEASRARSTTPSTPSAGSWPTPRTSCAPRSRACAPTSRCCSSGRELPERASARGCSRTCASRPRS